MIFAAYVLDLFSQVKLVTLRKAKSLNLVADPLFNIKKNDL